MGTPSRAGKAPRPSRKVMKSLLTPVGLDAAETVMLPSTLGSKEAPALRDQILEQRGKAIELDGSGVERLGGLGLQVLLSADTTWKQDGQRLRIVRPSEAFRKALSLFGAETLTASAAQE